eukprot:3941561-Rhodomonas_salina.1
MYSASSVGRAASTGNACATERSLAVLPRTLAHPGTNTHAASVLRLVLGRRRTKLYAMPVLDMAEQASRVPEQLRGPDYGRSRRCREVGGRCSARARVVDSGADRYCAGVAGRTIRSGVSTGIVRCEIKCDSPHSWVGSGIQAEGSRGPVARVQGVRPHVLLGHVVDLDGPLRLGLVPHRLHPLHVSTAGQIGTMQAPNRYHASAKSAPRKHKMSTTSTPNRYHVSAKSVPKNPQLGTTSQHLASVWFHTVHQGVVYQH